LAEQSREAIRAAQKVRAIIDEKVQELPPEIAAAAKKALAGLSDAVANAKASSSPDSSAHRNRLQVADPVDLSSGHLDYSFFDMHMDGAGMPLELERTHRGRARYPNGPLGVGWDYSLNRRARRESPDVVVVNSGEFREDRYTLTSPRPGALNQDDYYAPPDG